ncbi:hypothetical protein HLB44_10925 [Aquincola sp. S2]|uniref:Uncharacterized protein n=1 Tax=Pseudaquabacterium terrae TaxID=2732868 RepID=A0ABX2EFT9_9BURK|nr:hypothetical protein [Aquabacterium terrae]NRF67499.1 hypothetical protein [Aquabacterium terrae]
MPINPPLPELADAPPSSKADVPASPSPEWLRAEALFTAPAQAPAHRMAGQGGPVIVIRKRRQAEPQREGPTTEADAATPDGVRVTKVHRVARADLEAAGVAPNSGAETDVVGLRETPRPAPVRTRRSRPERRPSAVVLVPVAPLPVPARLEPVPAAPKPGFRERWASIDARMRQLERVLDDIEKARALRLGLEAALEAQG